MSHLPTFPGMLFLTTFLWVAGCIPGGWTLPLCTDPSYLSQGYTYTIDPVTGDKVWSFCHFPDPRNDHAFCGLPDWSSPAFICDPDRLIDVDQNVWQINSRLVEIETSTAKQCTAPNGERQGFYVIIVMVDNIRIGSLNDADSCMNDCGEIYPTVNTTARAATESEISLSMDTFAAGVRSELGVGACGNDLVFFYSQALNRVSIAMGWRVSDLLTSSDISDLQSTFLSYVTNGQLEEGLLYVADKLRTELRGVTPATIMLIFTLVGAAVLLLVMIFYLSLPSAAYYNVWGYEGPSKVIDVTVKTVTGVYAIDWVMQATSHLSVRVTLWPVSLAFVIGVTCIVVYAIWYKAYNDW